MFSSSHWKNDELLTTVQLWKTSQYLLSSQRRGYDKNKRRGETDGLCQLKIGLGGNGVVKSSVVSQ